MNLISIQSHVAYGHVGNSAAVFALQRLGCEVWPVHTVQFSNHTGYGVWKGEVFAAARIGEIIDGIGDLGVLGTCDGVLSGYIGAVETGEAILASVGKVKAANPNTSYCCDPVIGNRARGEFVRPGIVEFMRQRAVPAAQVVTPNHFELDRLVGYETTSLAAILRAAADIHARGPRAVLITSVRSDETPDGMLDVIASDPNGRYLVRTPRLATPANGAGDLIAALFFFHYLRSGSAAAALAAATSSVFGLLRRTHAVGASEMALIAAQDELVTPSEKFAPVKIGF
ncbi:MAG TPA: pyridoxal kinase PdxY [Xanthobacteraceae bacterium]|nr:pyridoxal kinase PdxY [Xanthobacteraceae bacterium]